MFNVGPKPNTAGRGPRSRMCYVCGRQTLLAGYDWHVQQCKDLFIKREELKPKKERRPIPQDPMIAFAAAGLTHGQLNQKLLDEYNEATERSFQNTLAPCAYCGRTFLPEKLKIHNRSCTASNPAKSVGRAPDMSNGHATIAATEPGSLPAIRPILNPAARTSGDIFDKKPKTTGVRFQTFESPPVAERPLKAAPVYSNFEDYANSVVPATMKTCPDCGRHFNEEAFSHHVNACKKVFLQQRKPYDSRKHRIQGTDIETIKPPKTPKGSAPRPGSMRDVKAAGSNDDKNSTGWKNQSAAFRDAIRAARQISIAERHAKATGQPLAAVLPPPIIRTPDDPAYNDYIQCPHCGRKYNQTAGARHIPKCKDTFAKPTRLIKGSGHAAVPVHLR